MNKRLLIIVVTMCVVASAWASEFRSFTNKDGKVIVARVIDYDGDAGKVQLELKNRKKAWVELSTLSDTDQKYIRDLANAESKDDESTQDNTNPVDEPLSREEIKGIVEKYIRALLDKDIETVKLLFCDEARVHNFGEGALQRDWDSIEIASIEDSNVYIVLNGRDEDEIDGSGWVQLTQAGKIKYCPLLEPHPIEKAADSLSRLNFYISSDKPISDGMRKRYIGMISSTGIPMHNLNGDMSRNKMSKAMRDIRRWIQKHGDEYDKNEPKVFLPEERLSYLNNEILSF